MPKLNILFIAHYGRLYGANKSLFDLIDGLQNYDINIFVILPETGDLSRELDRRNIQYKILPVPLWVTAFDFSPFYKISVLLQLLGSLKDYIQFVNQGNIDIIYTNSSVTPIGRLIALLTKRPHIWHIREFLDLDYSLRFIFPKSMALKLIKSSNAVICNSMAVKYHFFTNNSHDISVIYNGIASKKEFDCLQHNNNNRKSTKIFTFCIIGQIYSKKGQDIAITAISEIRKRGIPCRLIIAGDGSKGYVDYCKNLVHQFNLEDDVIFTGYISDPYNIYFSSDCLLMCSEYEAMGRVTVEAMSASLPVIGKNSGGTPEIVAHKQSGFLYENFDELVSYMIKFISEPDLAKEMGLKGWEIAKERFNTEIYSNGLFSVIKSI
jgi:glycosyltransferase involved in cell wall biosynthesis